MKKFAFGVSLFLSLCFSQMAFGQQPELGSCDAGINQAQRDFKHGIRRVNLWGIAIDYNYLNALKAKGIEVATYGCTINHDIICYSDQMERLIESERGEGFFQKLREVKSK